MKKLSSVLLVICILATAMLGIFSASAADPAPKTYEGWIETRGTPIFSNFEDINTGDPIDYVLTGNAGISTSGGSQDYWVMNDGYVVDDPSVLNGRLIFDSYLPGFTTARTEYYGYTFAQSYKISELMFQQGKIDGVGKGYFNDLCVEAKIDGEWKTVESNVADVYKQGATNTDFTKCQKFNIVLKTPTVCDGIRIKGSTTMYTSIVELKVKAVELTLTDACVENISTPFVSPFWDDGFTTAKNGVPGTGSNTGGSTSGGSFTLTTICDGITASNAKAYDNYKKSAGIKEHVIGYTFPSAFTVEKLMYQNGGVNANGGYFTSAVVEALVNGAWVEVASDIATAYPAASESFGSYTITLTRPVTCDGIRLSGTAGGAHPYISCNEFKVYTTEEHENNLKYAQENTPVNNTYDVRLLSVLDRTDYDKAGFEITTKVGDKSNTVTKDIVNVYTAVLADGKTYTADAGTYFAVLTLEDIPTGLGNVSFTVTPYCVENGVTYYGGAVTVTYDTNGALVVA